MRSDTQRLFDILNGCRNVEEYISTIASIKELEGNKILQGAILYEFVVIGEACSRISSELKLSNPHVPWTQVADFRNFVVHDYFGVKWSRVWRVATNRVPELRKNVEQILAGMKRSTDDEEV